MSDITAERRLELIRNIREENNRNRMNMRNRESILYGQNYDKVVTYEEEKTSTTSTTQGGMLFFRILAAIILFSLFVILDYNKATWFSLNTDIICNYLKENYTLNSFDFIKEITYTLEDM